MGLVSFSNYLGEKKKKEKRRTVFSFSTSHLSSLSLSHDNNNSNTNGKATGRVTLALGDEGLLVLVDESEPPVAVWTSGPHGLKALFENVKAGATHLAERAAYYSSAAYTESKAKSAEILEKVRK